MSHIDDLRFNFTITNVHAPDAFTKEWLDLADFNFEDPTAATTYRRLHTERMVRGFHVGELLGHDTAFAKSDNKSFSEYELEQTNNQRGKK